MSTHPRVRLDCLASTIESGFPCSKSRLVENGLLHLRPFNIGSNGQLYLNEEYRVPFEIAPSSKANLYAGDILFNNTNSPALVGKVAVISEDLEAGFSNHLTRVRVDTTRCEPAFVAAHMRRLWLHGYFRDKCTQWVSQAGFGPHLLADVRIPLPPLDEQRRIVDILNRAAKIERLRTQAQERLREFIPALFIKMFGDPVENPMGWVEPSLGVIANNCFRNGLSPSSNGLVGGEVLTLSAITCGWFDFSKRKSARFERAPSSSQMLSQKTFLICRGNGNKRLVGAGAFPDRESSCVCYPDTMIGVTVDPKIVAPAYLQYVWASQRVRSQIERAARTTNGTHKVDQRVLSAVVFPLPPIVLQRRFAKIVESTRSAATIGTSNSCDLTASLMSRLLDNAA